MLELTMTFRYALLLPVIEDGLLPQSDGEIDPTIPKTTVGTVIRRNGSSFGPNGSAKEWRALLH